MKTWTPYYPAVGERVAVDGCYSEVMMHFRLAGKPVEIAVLPSTRMNGEIVAGSFVGQVYVDGRPFSAPILTGEAGFYEDDRGFYTYPRADA